MSGLKILDATILAISLFNAILLTWLGFTVLLNSDRRRWGIWIAGGGLLLGALFFISHTAILGLGLLAIDRNTLIFWFLVGILSAVMLPYAWYVTMLWYAGYWQDTQSPLHKRQRPWLWLATALLILGMIAIIAIMASLGINQSRYGPLFQTIRWSASGVPLVVFSFSGYVLLNIMLSLHALYRPGPSAREMGQLARRRARPWLIAASFALILVGLLVAIVLAWVGSLAQGNSIYGVYANETVTIAIFDLLISALIGLVILLLGQAIVSYEVFTGKTLPRRGLLRHWQRAVYLAAGYSILVGAVIVLDFPTIYALLITALLMTLFYALVSWRSYIERERLMASLRPFITTQGLFDQLVAGSPMPDVDPLPAFEALCTAVLDTKRACLTAVGPLAPLVDKPLFYPAHTPISLPPLATLLRQVSNGDPAPISLDPGIYQGLLWAVPLWSQRGLIGLLFLGEKRSGGLYAQEEMEIGRFTGERIVDTLAGAALSSRLMTLQRQRLAETQIADQQTRRILHDEILPDLHAAMISISESDGSRQETALNVLADTHRRLSDLLQTLPATSIPDIERKGFIGAIQWLVNQEFAADFQDVAYRVEPSVLENERRLPKLSAEVLYYATREVIRNAVRHGREPGEKTPLLLTITAAWRDGLELKIADNGVGLSDDQEGSAGAGQGLALHSTMMAVIGGTLSLSSSPNNDTRVTLFAPIESGELS